MAVNRVIGLRKIYVHPATFNDTTLPPFNSSLSEDNDHLHWDDLGDVYMESATLVDDDPEVVVHKSETSSRKITVSKPGDLRMQLQLMDPDYDLLARYFGGTVITDARGNRSYERPVKFQARPFAIVIIPTEGDALTCPVCGISSKYNITYNETGIMLLDMTITMNQPVTFNEAIDQYGPMYGPTFSLTITTNNDTLGTVAGSGTYQHGASVQITATPATDHTFQQWSDGDTNPSRTITINNDTELQAIFE